MASNTYDKRPQVVIVNPKTNSVNIPTTTAEILIGFNTDLDTNSLNGNFRLQDRDGKMIPVNLKYENRTVTLVITESLQPNMMYHIMIFGDSGDGSVKGVRNIFGTPMAGIYETSFTTEILQAILPPKIIFPLNQTVIKEKPVFKWEASLEAGSYEIVLSQSNLLVPVIWPAPDTYYHLTEVQPSVELKDGYYYWKVRCIGTDGRKGDWSPIYQFALHTGIEAPVTEEDTLPPEEGITYDSFLDDLSVEIAKTFPNEGTSNVKATLKTVYIQVTGTVTAEEVSVSMMGEHVTGEDSDHGEVSGVVEILPQTDGTTIIAFTPVVLG